MSPVKKEKTKGGRKEEREEKEGKRERGREEGKKGRGRWEKAEEGNGRERKRISFSEMQFTVTFGPWYPWISHLQIQPSLTENIHKNLSLLNMYRLF